MNTSIFILFSLLTICDSFVRFHATNRISRKSSLILESSSKVELDVGDFESCKLAQTEALGDDFAKYRLDATISSTEMNKFLEEYKAEMKRRKVVFPGFRPGKLPPYVMGDVRRYIVSFGLESMLGQLCNINGLSLCNKDKENAAFGEDAYYKEIIVESNGMDFEQQRDSWKEGTDFSFAAEFFAIMDTPTEITAEEPKTDENVIDTSIVESNEVKSVDVEKTDEKLTTVTEKVEKPVVKETPISEEKSTKSEKTEEKVSDGWAPGKITGF